MKMDNQDDQKDLIIAVRPFLTVSNKFPNQIITDYNNENIAKQIIQTNCNNDNYGKL
jgi:hypothetical protein